LPAEYYELNDGRVQATCHSVDSALEALRHWYDGLEYPPEATRFAHNCMRDTFPMLAEHVSILARTLATGMQPLVPTDVEVPSVQVTRREHTDGSLPFANGSSEVWQKSLLLCVRVQYGEKMYRCEPARGPVVSRAYLFNEKTNARNKDGSITPCVLKFDPKAGWHLQQAEARIVPLADDAATGWETRF
jgi:hypothetical protein